MSALTPPLPNGLSSATTTAPSASIAACRAVESTGAPASSDPRSVERRSTGERVGRGFGKRDVALGLELPERAEQRQCVDARDARRVGAQRIEAPRRGARAIGVRDLAAQVVRLGLPTCKARELGRQRARSLRVVGSRIGAVRMQQIEQQDGRQRRPRRRGARARADRENTCSRDPRFAAARRLQHGPGARPSRPRRAAVGGSEKDRARARGSRRASARRCRARRSARSPRRE